MEPIDVDTQRQHDIIQQYEAEIQRQRNEIQILQLRIQRQLAEILRRDNTIRNQQAEIQKFRAENQCLPTPSQRSHQDENQHSSLPSRLPTFVRIEASTLCQLNCTSCYMRLNDSGSVGKGFLKYEDFKKFLDEHSFIQQVELANSGEIFLNPELAEIIKYAHSKNVMLTAGSGVNFNTVKDEMLELLVQCKFNRLNISIDGASQEIYSQYRVNGNFDAVISNIKRLNEYKKTHNSAFPTLAWQYVIMSHNECEVVKAKELAKALNMQIFFKLTWDQDYAPTNAEMLKKETGLKYLTREDFAKKNTSSYLQACKQLFDSPQINWDGRLLGCCCVYRDDFGVNVFEIGLKKALEAETYTYAKKMLQGKVSPPEQKIPNIPCCECGQYKKMLANNNFLVRH